MGTFVCALMGGGAGRHTRSMGTYRCGRTFWGFFGVETRWALEANGQNP